MLEHLYEMLLDLVADLHIGVVVLLGGCQKDPQFVRKGVITFGSSCQSAAIDVV